MNNIKILVIGYGSIGRRHYEILSHIDEVEIVDVVSKQSLDDIKTYTLLENVDLDVYDYIVIASETHKHFEQLNYLEQNTKNKLILVEKPLFSTDEVLSIKKNKVFVAYNRRFYPIINKIKSLIRNDNCYYINIITGQYLPQWRPSRDYRETYSAKKNGGGVLLDLSHEIDYINYLCGEMKVLSSINTKISDLEIESDDIAVVIAKTDNNVIVNFSIDYISKKFIQTIVVHLKESTLIANFMTMRLEQIFKDGRDNLFDLSEFNKNYSFEQMHKDILFNNQKVICSYDEGVNIMKTICNIKKLSNEK